MANTRSLVLSGIVWSSIQLIVNTSFTFLIKLVLAKLLFPEQFGLIGIATVVIGFVKVLNDLGIGAYIVQKKDQDLSELHYHTSFWTGVFWSVGLFLIMSVVVAPLAASFYSEPILTYIIPVLSIGILTSPVNLIHKAQLTKSMQFKKMAYIDNVSNISTGILSVVLALLGAGVWSLVFNSVVTIFIAMPLYFRATRWKPKWVWDKKSFKQIFGFGIYTTGTSVVNYLIGNIDYMIIGKLISTQALGAYSFAFILTDTFRSRLMTVINNVMYPVYGKQQDNPSSIKKYYLKIVNYNSIIIFPIMSSFIVLGDEIILNIFGDKWQDSILPLKLLSFSVMIHMMVNSNTALIRGIGRPDLEMKLQIIKAFIFIPSLIFGILNYGIVGAGISIIFNKIIAVIIAQYTFNKLIDIKISTKEFLIAIKDPWIASIVSVVAVYLLKSNFQMHYILLIAVLFAIYSLIVYLFVGKEIKTLISQYLSSKKMKST